MARTNKRKPYYKLSEIFARWSMDADDISAYVLAGELTLSLPVAALLMEVSETHQTSDGRIRLEAKGRQHQVGPIDISRIDAYAVMQDGSRRIARFLTPTDDLLEPVDDNGERHALAVKRTQLVVRHDELERFEMEHDLGRPDEHLPSAPLPVRAWPAPAARGAPPRHDWEDFMCELGVIAHNEGLPEVQAETVRRMMDWFSVTYGADNVPSESAVKQRVSRFYHRLRGEEIRASPPPPPRRGGTAPAHGKNVRANT